MNDSSNNYPQGDRRILDRLNQSYYLNLIRDYCQLAIQPDLSDDDAERLGQLLHQAKSDSILDFWIQEADHFLDHELGLCDDGKIYVYQNEIQKVTLRKHLARLWENEAAGELMEDLREDLRQGAMLVQQQLKDLGFDPGQIDGIPGPKTQQAIARFQQQHHLPENGIADETTQASLFQIAQLSHASNSA
jgi:hypothetical protein